MRCSVAATRASWLAGVDAIVGAGGGAWCAFPLRNCLLSPSVVSQSMSIAVSGSGGALAGAGGGDGSCTSGTPECSVAAGGGLAGAAGGGLAGAAGRGFAGAAGCGGTPECSVAAGGGGTAECPVAAGGGVGGGGKTHLISSFVNCIVHFACSSAKSSGGALARV